MGVSLAPVARPGLSPSCPRIRHRASDGLAKALWRGQASSPLLPLPWIPAPRSGSGTGFAGLPPAQTGGMTKPAPFNARLFLCRSYFDEMLHAACPETLHGVYPEILRYRSE